MEIRGESPTTLNLQHQMALEEDVKLEFKMERQELPGVKPETGLEGPGDASSATQMETLRQPLSWAEPQTIKQEPGEELSSQQWETQWQEFLKTVQTPQNGEANPQLPWSETFMPSFREAAATNQWTRKESGPRPPPGTVQQVKVRPETVSRSDPRQLKEIKREDADSLEVQRQHFRQFCYRDAQGPREVYGQLWELCHRWLTPAKHSKEQILDLVILEQFLAVLPSEMQNWVKEQGSESCFQAVSLAEDFLLRQQEARKVEQQGLRTAGEVVVQMAEGERSLKDPGRKAKHGEVVQESYESRASLAVLV